MQVQHKATHNRDTCLKTRKNCEPPVEEKSVLPFFLKLAKKKFTGLLQKSESLGG